MSRRKHSATRPGVNTSDSEPVVPPLPNAAQLRVLLIDDDAHRVSLIRDELTWQGHVAVGMVDSALAIRECVVALKPEVVIVDAELPGRETLGHLAVMSATTPRSLVSAQVPGSEHQHAAAVGGAVRCKANRAACLPCGAPRNRYSEPE
jgi:PleD family two-component response regulator